MANAIISQDTTEKYKYHWSLAVQCASIAIASKHEYWRHIYEIKANRLWAAEFERLEDWISHLTMLKEEEGGCFSRALFFQKTGAIEQLVNLSMGIEDSVKAVVETPAAVNKILALDKETQEHLGVKKMLDDISEGGLSAKEALAFVSDKAKEEQTWVSEIKFKSGDKLISLVNPETECDVIMMRVHHQWWERDDGGEWFMELSDQWVELRFTDKYVNKWLLDKIGCKFP